MANTNTRTRLLHAAEVLFIQHGYEAMSLRQITSKADANMASVNYYFGGKELLIHEVMANRLDRLNHERLHLLSCCEREQAGRPLAITAILSVLFVPALRLSRAPKGDPMFMRLLGRVYSDTSPLIRHYLREHYRPISERFFEAFSLALPELSRTDLSMRLRFCLQSVAGVLAAEGIGELIGALSTGQAISESVLLARLIALVLPMLTVSLDCPDQISAVERIVRISDADAQDSAANTKGAPAEASLAWSGSKTNTFAAAVPREPGLRVERLPTLAHGPLTLPRCTDVTA